MALTDSEQAILEPFLEKIRSETREHGSSQYDVSSPGAFFSPLYPTPEFWQAVRTTLDREGFEVLLMGSLWVRRI